MPYPNKEELSYWSDDPILEVLDSIPEAAARSTAYRLFIEERIPEVETLLRMQGVLSCDGELDSGRFGFSFDRIDEIETDSEVLATLSHDYGYNRLEAHREGWLIKYVAYLDGPHDLVLESTTPISEEGVIAILNGTGVVDYLRETDLADCTAEDLRGRWLWTSSSHFYPGLDRYFAEEESEWIAGLEEAWAELEDEESEVADDGDEARDGGAASRGEDGYEWDRDGGDGVVRTEAEPPEDGSQRPSLLDPKSLPLDGDLAIAFLRRDFKRLADNAEAAHTGARNYMVSGMAQADERALREAVRRLDEVRTLQAAIPILEDLRIFQSSVKGMIHRMAAEVRSRTGIDRSLPPDGG
jgi:hypothetical protein